MKITAGTCMFYVSIAAIWLLLIVFAGSVICGCNTYRGEYPAFEEELPVVNVSYEMRQHNYTPGGSCVHASLITLLRWQNRSEEAAMWRREFSGGEWATSVARKLDSRGIRYAYTSEGDVEFLEWACRTRRGAGVTVRGGAHMVTLTHLDDEWAVLLDNNNISKFIWLPRQEFIDEWQASHGWAVTPIYSPHAPLPY
ncbi:MAG: hypothetical protein ACYS7Y_32965 [Planctomycetota bacterium]|jgi:predicted small secreted protein